MFIETEMTCNGEMVTLYAYGGIGTMVTKYSMKTSSIQLTTNSGQMK